MVSYTSSRSETKRPTSVGFIKTSWTLSHNAQEALVSLPAFHTSIIRVRPPSLDCMNSMYCFTVGHDFFIFVQLAQSCHATIHPQEPLNLFAGQARACTKDICFRVFTTGILAHSLSHCCAGITNNMKSTRHCRRIRPPGSHRNMYTIRPPWIGPSGLLKSLRNSIMPLLENVEGHLRGIELGGIGGRHKSTFDIINVIPPRPTWPSMAHVRDDVQQA